MAAATAATASWMRFKGGKERKLTKMNKSRINCSYSSSSSVIDPYKTLRIKRGASESEVRKAFRQLALQVSIPSPNPCIDILSQLVFRNNIN